MAYVCDPCVKVDKQLTLAPFVLELAQSGIRITACDFHVLDVLRAMLQNEHGLSVLVMRGEMPDEVAIPAEEDTEQPESPV